MECPYCKAQNRDGVRYCGNCGKYIDSEAASSSTGSTGNVPRLLAPGTRLQGGRYVIKRVLGQGGMGAALLATDNRLDGKQVVIKELISENTDGNKFQDDVRNFKREVAMLAHIDHPLIPNVTDHFQEGSRYFMVQEFVDGENLEERLDRLKQPLMEREVLICASETLDVLDYLAQQNPPIVHRDIKPANIIIGNKDRRAHLVDFGIARADVVKNAQRKQTSALGTPGYAPPEQYQGNADPRSDLYALAATLHHVLTNRDPRNYPPFVYPPVRTLNPQVSIETEQVLTRALMNDINQRYPSAVAMKQEIDAILRNRFGVSGNISTYMIGASGPMPVVDLQNTILPSSGAMSGSMQPVSTPTPPLGLTPSPTVVQQPTPLPPTMVQQPTPLPPTVMPQPTPPPYPYTPPTLSASQGLQAGQAYPISQGGQPYSGSQGIGGQPYPVFQGPPSFPPPPPQPQKRRSKLLPFALALLLLLVLLGGGLYAASNVFHVLGGNANGIGVTKVGNNEYIGISDGTYIFDTGRPNNTLKQQAAQQLKQKSADTSTVISLLSQATAQETNDAEGLIYLENERVLNSGAPYVTVVVATMLTGSDELRNVGRDDLQGAYVAQKEFNDGSKLHGGYKVRLLIANSGSLASYANQVAVQIVQLAKADATFVGVMGWPYSSRTLDAVKTLGDAHIPMISQTASSDALSGVSPYFFRVAPSNKAQGKAGADYATHIVKARSVVMFEDSKDTYSQSLAQDFSEQFQADGGQVVAREQYTVAKPATIPDGLQDALAHHPDLIYFSGYAADVSTLLVNLPPGNIPVLGGDALYELGGYSSSTSANFNRLRFTAFAYPDEWDVLGYGSQKPGFFQEYTADFDPGHVHKVGTYGFTRAGNDVILSYDAVQVLLQACNKALSTQQKIVPQDVQQALQKMVDGNGVQGVSGYIAFDQNGDPVNKAFVLLKVSPEGFIQMTPNALGQFLR